MDLRSRGLIPPLDLERAASAVALSLHGVYLILTALALAEFGIILALPPKLRPEHAPSAAPAPAHGTRSA
jgi:hypothetical protein